MGDEAQDASSELASQPTGSVQEQTASVEPAIVAAADPNGPAEGSVTEAGGPAAGEPTESELAEVEIPNAEGDTAETTGTVPSGDREPDATQTAALGENGAEDYVKASAAFEAGDCAAALRYYERAFEKGGLPRRALAAGHNNRGRCFYDRGGFEDALADFDRAIGLDRKFAAAYYNRGRVHNAMGHRDDAKADLQTAYDLGFGRLQVEE